MTEPAHAPDWRHVATTAAMAQISTESLLNVIATARTRGVSAEVVLEGYRRTVNYWTDRDNATLKDTEWLPPGFLDIRILDQDLIWIDVLRTAHTIGDRTDVTDDYLTNIIGWLQNFAPSLAAVSTRAHGRHLPADPLAWLERTPLLRALRDEATRRQI